jgi:hypothetical protein
MNFVDRNQSDSAMNLNIQLDSFWGDFFTNLSLERETVQLSSC